MTNEVVRKLAGLVKAAAIVLLILIVAPRLVSAALSTSCAPLLATAVIDRTDVSSLVSEIRALSDLELGRYEGQVFAEREVPAGILGIRITTVRVFRAIRGSVSAGVDLSGFSEADVVNSGERLVVYLPEPGILTSEVESGVGSVFPRGLPLGSADDIALIEDALVEEARSELSLRALEAGLVDSARESLRQHVLDLAHAAGHEGVVEIVFGGRS